MYRVTFDYGEIGPYLADARTHARVIDLFVSHGIDCNQTSARSIMVETSRDLTLVLLRFGDSVTDVCETQRKSCK